ncbi:hypothetical protein JX265_012278 [Neoarthrinium moseri]|uniref:Uncharacterized protein n=1 Tax=Neoarthrinium moseri TaxID=1658444 RepID=A0A9Q0AGV6_9PEZI|nr:hypothetical protein JX265_012278 [Neoarthrinium moseri]
MTSTSNPAQSHRPTAPPLPPRGSQLWFADKLSQKKDPLTYSLITLAAARLVWITQVQGRKAKARSTAVAPQLVVWAIFWPTALVVLRTGVKWADTTVAKAGLKHPSEKPPRGEVEGDSRHDV